MTADNNLSARRRNGDPYRIRTDVKGVRGLCLNHLTNGPFPFHSGAASLFNAPSKPNNVTRFLLSRLCLHIQNCRSSPRLISIGQLNTLLHLHFQPINQVVLLGPYS